MLTRVLLLAQAAICLVGALVLSASPQQPAPQLAGPRPVAETVAAVPTSSAAVTKTAPVRPAAARPAAVTKKVTGRATARVRVTKSAPPRTAPRVAAAPRPVAARPNVPEMTAQQALEAALGRLPGYRAGSTAWVFTNAYGSWGTADWYNNRVYLSPGVPQKRMYDVVAHEWSHLLSVQPYSGDVAAAIAAMNEWFGGAGFTGPDRAADCMARRLGAQWTHYTPCSDAHWQQGAQILLSGRVLPRS